MMRFSGIRPVILAIVAVLFAWSGAVMSEAPRAEAVTPPATDARARAIYFHMAGDKAQRQWTLESMTAASAWRGAVWRDFLASWDQANTSFKANLSIPEGLPQKGHVFVVLGSALTSSGGITAKLERRLKIALTALAKYPNSKVLVTGGAPRNGKTEAQVMFNWLVARGIARARILVESQSSSTIGNATKSMAILRNTPDITTYTLVSDASQMRRATVLFNAAFARIQEQTGIAWPLAPASHVAFWDRTEPLPNPPSPATNSIIASNVAYVFGVLTQYRALVSSPPPAPVLTSIDVTAPTTAQYAVGESLDTSGLRVTARYNGGAYARVVTDDAAISGFTSANVGSATARVTYAEGGVRVAATFPYSIVKAASKVTLRLSTLSITRGVTRVSVTAKVTTGAPVVPVGKVRFYLDGIRLRTILMTPEHNGQATFTYPTIGSAGTHRIKVTYVGSAHLEVAKSFVDVRVTG